MSPLFAYNGDVLTWCWCYYGNEGQWDQHGEFLLARAFCFQAQQTSVDTSLSFWEDSKIAGSNRWSLQRVSWLSVGVSIQLCDHDSLQNCCNSRLAINAQKKNASISEQCGKWKVSCNFAIELLIAAPIPPFNWPRIAHSSSTNNSIYTILGEVVGFFKSGHICYQNRMISNNW